MIDFSLISIWAVLIAAIVSFVIGGVWYAVAFRKAWIKAYGFSDEDIARMSARPHLTYPLLFGCDLVTAFALGVLITNLDITSPAQGGLFGLLVWIGIAGATHLATHHASGRPMRGFAIDSGKQATSLVVMGAILGAWHP